MKRLQTIVRFNLGLYDYLLKGEIIPNEIRVDYKNINKPVPPGTYWNAEGNFVLKKDGIRIDQIDAVGMTRLEMSSDNNDDYGIDFINGDRIVAQQLVRYREAEGIKWDTVGIPEEALKEGFDALHITPLRGDGLYSIGHVRFINGDEDEN